MSKELIAKARELGESVTAGPWMVKTWQQFDPGSDIARDIVGVQSETGHVIAECWSGNADAEAEFIAESRALMPALADLAESEGRRADEAERERAKSDAAYEALFRRTTTAINAMRTERDAAVAELAMLKVQVESMQPVLDAVHALQKANALREGPTWAAAFHPSLLAIINIQLPPKEQP